MKNILILCAEKIYLGNSAGSARMMNYANALASSDCRVFLCSSMLTLSHDKELLTEISPNIYVVGHDKNASINDQERKFSRFPNFFLLLSYLQKLLALLSDFDGDKIFFLYPTFISSMDYAVLVYSKLFSNMKVYCEINELRRTNIYQNVHANNIKNGLGKLLYFSRIVKFRVNEFLTKYFDGLICISTSLQEYFGKYNSNILRIPILTSDLNNSKPAPPQFKFGDTFKMCFTGFLSVEKEGFDIFYRALEQLNAAYPKFELHLYGYGTKSDMRILVNEMPEKMNFRDKIIYHGFVEQEQIQNELKKYDLLILPRNSNPQTEYGFSTKLGEYLSSGVPVLLTAVSDNKMYLKDGENGFIVEPGSDTAFSNKMHYIINHYSEIVPQLILNAVKTVNANFYYGNYSNTLHEFIK